MRHNLPIRHLASRFTSAAAIAAIMMAACAFGQQPSRHSTDAPISAYVQRMMSLDRNRDGLLTADELPGKLADLLAKHDTNSDKAISPEELSVVETQAMSQRDDANNKAALSDQNSEPVRRGGRRVAGGRGAGAGGFRGPGNRDRGNQIKGSPLDAEQILRFALTFDADQDGSLNAEELRRYAVALAARRAQARGRTDGGSDNIDREDPPRKAAPAGLSDPNDNSDPFGNKPAESDSAPDSN